MTRFRWINKERSASCAVKIKGSAYHLYVAVAPDRQGEAIWSVRMGGQWGRLIASGFAPALDPARARAEFYAARWAGNEWGLYFGDPENFAKEPDLAG